MDSQKGLKLVEKAVEVLDRLAENGELSVAQLATITGEPRSSLYRLISSLESLGLVEQASSRGLIRLGTKLIYWGAATQSGLSVRDRALPIMREINQETGLTTYLLVRRGNVGVCMERLEGIRVASLALLLGGSLPLHVGAAPRALLAFSNPDSWEEYANNNVLESPVAEESMSKEGLFTLLESERKQGFTISDGDVSLGISSIGAPVFNHKNSIEAAISVSGIHSQVLGENRERHIEHVVDGARRISELMGAKP